MVKEKKEFLIQVSVKRKKTGDIHNLKRYVQLEVDWEESKAVNFDTVSEKGGIISFESKDKVPEEDGHFDYRFRIKELELKKGFFKDKVISWKLEPVQDKESIQTFTCWGTRVEPTQYRASGFLIIGTTFLLLVGGILAWALWKKHRHKQTENWKNLFK